MWHTEKVFKVEIVWLAFFPLRVLTHTHTKKLLGMINIFLILTVVIVSGICICQIHQIVFIRKGGFYCIPIIPKESCLKNSSSMLSKYPRLSKYFQCRFIFEYDTHGPDLPNCFTLYIYCKFPIV